MGSKQTPARPQARGVPLTPPDPGDGRAKGVVQRLLPERGFGFIRCTEGPKGDLGQDFFFHTTGLEDLGFEELEIGQLVSFEARDVPKGKRAERIQRG